MPINVTRSFLPDFEEYSNEIRDLWDSHWLTNMGIKHQTLQENLEAYLDCPHVTLFTNGHLALENILTAMGFPRGSEVITTPYTFASTTHAIVRCGLIPVFCDIDPEDFTIDVTKIENLITEKTVAILPVHVYGNICNVEAIDRIAKSYGLKVIYDAAHAFGTKYKGVSPANFGDASMFSFHATKVFHTIEGGAACFRGEELWGKLYCLKNFGIVSPESCVYVGGNAKMNEFQAAMGICNLRHLDEEISERKKVVEKYTDILKDIPGIRIPKVQKNVESNYAYYPLIFDGFKKSRNRIYEELMENGIIARKYFYPITNSFECYKDYPTAGAEKTPVAQYLSERVLTLPLYGALSSNDIERICRILSQP